MRTEYETEDKLVTYLVTYKIKEDKETGINYLHITGVEILKGEHLLALEEWPLHLEEIESYIKSNHYLKW